jgi:prepilin-type N-terminal cleavage/methylation domain-containing protein
MKSDFRINNFKQANKGYTLVELLVALAVSAIVISGTLAGYTVFSKQYDVLNKRMEIDREMLVVIDLIQRDVMMAGFQSRKMSIKVKSADALVRASATDFSMVYDHQENELDPVSRRLVRYSLGPGYISSDGGETRKKLYRDLRNCTTPVAGCTIATSTSLYSAGGQGEVIIDKITNFTVTFSSPKPFGHFAGVSQLVKIDMSISASRKVQDASDLIAKNFKFITRAKNVSLL